MMKYMITFVIAFATLGSVANADCRWCAKCNTWHCDNNQTQVQSQPMAVQPVGQQIVGQQFMAQPMQAISQYTQQVFSQPAQTVNQAGFFQAPVPGSSTMQYATFPMTQQYNGGNFAQEVLRLTNNYRLQNGLQPLTLSQNMGAQSHAQQMSANNSMFHGSGYTENVGYGNLSPQRVVNMWINSPTHRQNILGNYRQLDVGKSGNGWVQRFR